MILAVRNGVARALLCRGRRCCSYATTATPQFTNTADTLDPQTAIETIQHLQKHYSDRSAIVEHAFNTYNSVTSPKTSLLIVAMLKICLSFNALHQAPYLWTDILNLSTITQPEPTSITAYLLFLKCCTKSPLLPLDRCMETLELMASCPFRVSSPMDRRDYSKSVHRVITQCTDPHLLPIIDSIVKRIGIHDVYIQTAFLNAFAKQKEPKRSPSPSSSSEETVSKILAVFNGLSNVHKDSAFMNTTMKWLIHYNQSELALVVYDEYTFLHDDVSHILALKSAMKCGSEQNHRGKVIYSQITVQSDINLKNALIEFFGFFGEIENAQKVFHEISDSKKDRVSIGTMLKWMVHHGQYLKALDLYDSFEGLHDDKSHQFAIRACTYSDQFERGKGIRSRLSEDANQDPFIAATLIDFYGNFGSISTAKRVFNALPQHKRDLIVTASMMDAFCKSDLHIDCLQLFKSLLNGKNGKHNKGNNHSKRERKPDLVCYAIAIKACAQGTCYHFGRELHDELRNDQSRNWMSTKTEIESGFINFYGKCGDFEIAETLFMESKNRNDVSVWNAMINAYGRNGQTEKAKEMLFNLLKEGVVPDIHTFIFLINACGHSGDIEDAKLIWEEVADQEVKYNKFVVCALVDCLARHGSFEKAKRLVNDYESNADGQYHFPMWMALMSGCCKNGDTLAADRIHGQMEKRFKGKNDELMRAASMLLSNLHGTEGDFEKRNEIRNAIEFDGRNTSRSVSEIEISGKIYSFKAGTEYTEMEDGQAIDDKLEELMSALKRDFGFQHNLKSVTRDVDWNIGETKESILCRQSEKLALVYGLLHSPKDSPIVINKYTRMNNDSRNFMMLASMRENRKIIVSEPNVVHKFTHQR